MNDKKIIITTGDPAGVGPYITVKSLLKVRLKNISVTVIGDKKLLSSVEGFSRLPSSIRFIDIPHINKIAPGIATRESGRASYEYLREALRLLRREKDSMLVTGPVSKEVVRMTRKGFIGHTEFLAQSFSVKDYAMMMVGRSFRIVFLTRHLKLRDVSGALSLSSIESTLRLLVHSLKNSFLAVSPVVGLCSCNPHAGIDTFLEKEERLLIKAVTRIKDKGLSFVGPYPADTLFKEALKRKFDALVVFYHDQGMIPFKTLDFSTGVNLTIGLPFVRTSPAHGPAFNLVDKPHLIDSRSMKEAILLAARLKPTGYKSTKT